jgi:uncharacterized membrane protein YeaQ/YmgE (transglycosylase-associated protein family)
MAHGIIAWLVIGGIAGWLAGLLVKGSGFGLIANILIGIVGAVIGGWLTTVVGVGVGYGFVSTLAVSVVGAVVLLLAINLLRRF